MKTPPNRNRQKGVAALLVTLVVLLSLTLVVVYATKVGMFDQRMAGNEARYKEAFAQAEAGLDFAVESFDSAFRQGGPGGIPVAYDGTQQSLTDIVNYVNTIAPVGTPITTDGTAPAGEGSFTFSVTASGASFGSIPIYTFSGIGTGADGTGTATVQRQATMANALGGAVPDVPIVVDGAVGTGGDFNIVANPNGGGPGVPVSVWTGGPSPDGDVALGGSTGTCHLQYYNGNNAQCSNSGGGGSGELITEGNNSTLSAYNAASPDILPNDTVNFPPDLFQYLFGIPNAQWQTKYNEAFAHGQVADDCTGLDATSGVNYPLWWITDTNGDGVTGCQLGPNQVIGSTADPVILVIDNTTLTMQGNGAIIYGIVYIFDNPDKANTGGNPPSPGANMSGSPQIIGSFVSDVGGNAMQGSYAVVYDPDVLTQLSGNSGNSYTLSYVPGSWRDF